MTAPPQFTIDQTLCFSLYSASIAVTRAYKPLLDELGITYPQYLVLQVLWERDEDTIGGIASRLALESSTVTPLVKRLEQSGLLTRRRNPDDEREVLVTLTPPGIEMQAKSACLGELLFKAAGLPVADLVALNDGVRNFRDSVAAFAATKNPDD